MHLLITVFDHVICKTPDAPLDCLLFWKISGNILKVVELTHFSSFVYGFQEEGAPHFSRPFSNTALAYKSQSSSKSLKLVVKKSSLLFVDNLFHSEDIRD